MDADTSLSIGYVPIGKTGKVALTVKGGTITKVFKVDILDETKREQAKAEIQDAFPALKESGPATELGQELVGIAEEVAAALANGTDGRPQRERDDGAEANQPLAQGKTALGATEPGLIAFARDFLRRPDLIEQVIEHAHLLGVAGEDELALMLYLIGTSRLLPRPLAGLVMGASSAGKSFVIRAVARLFPDEAVLQAHRISPRALERMPQGSLMHRFVVAGERSRQQDDAAAEATRALREMIGDGMLSAAVAVPKGASNWETVQIHQEGPIAYVESTTLGLKEIFDEDRTRFILLATDESQQQTSAVVAELARSASCPDDPDIPDSVVALHHTAQRLLRPAHVTVPFAGDLTGVFPTDKLEVRRAFGHMLSFIQAVALLHQHQRDQDATGGIVALPYDYDVVRERLAGPLGRGLGYALTPGAAGMLECVECIGGEFTVAEAAGKARCSDNTARGRLRELEGAGQIARTQEARGRAPAKYVLVESPPPLHGLVLPKLVQGGEGLLVPEAAADKP